MFDLALDADDSPHLVVSAGNQPEVAGLWILAGSSYDESIVDPSTDLRAVALHVDLEGAPHIAAVSSAGIAQSASVTYYRPGRDDFESHVVDTTSGNGGAVDIVVDEGRFPQIVAMGGGGNMSFIHY